MLFGAKFSKKTPKIYPDFQALTESILQDSGLPDAVRQTAGKVAALASHAMSISEQCMDKFLVGKNFTQPKLVLAEAERGFVIQHPEHAKAVRIQREIHVKSSSDVENNIVSLADLIKQRRILASQQWANARAA